MDPDADRLILQTAKELMHEHGYERMTIDGVAKRAGVARTTVYRRYRDKAESSAPPSTRCAIRPLDQTRAMLAPT